MVLTLSAVKSLGDVLQRGSSMFLKGRCFRCCVFETADFLQNMWWCCCINLLNKHCGSVCMSCKCEHVCITANELPVPEKCVHRYSMQNEVGQVLMCGLEHQMQCRKLILCLTTTTRFDNLAMQLAGNQQQLKLRLHATRCFKQLCCLFSGHEQN